MRYWKKLQEFWKIFTGREWFKINGHLRGRKSRRLPVHRHGAKGHPNDAPAPILRPSWWTDRSADIRNPISSGIVTKPSKPDTNRSENDKEKTWFLGNLVVMPVRTTMARAGWVKVMLRKPSGFSRLICCVEIVSMVGPGDVDPCSKNALTLVVEVPICKLRTMNVTEEKESMPEKDVNVWRD